MPLTVPAAWGLVYNPRLIFMAFLKYVPPMGIYETLYAFLAAFGKAMGEPGTHPWSQGFPRTDQLPGGPAMPTSITVAPDHLKYPKAWGLPALREAVAAYYRNHYGARITADNVMIFAGGRPALVATLYFLDRDIPVRVASTEYTPYFDMLERLGRTWSMTPSTVANRFTPPTEDYLAPAKAGRHLVMLSNPCNPTGVTRHGAELERLVKAASSEGTGLLVDEAYELFHDEPVSALRYAEDIDRSNLFVVGACTKGLQAPGIRIGWVVAARENIEILGNFSSFGMGGVSHPSQVYALELLKEERVTLARKAVPAFYRDQRARYGEAFAKLGLELFTGKGGFYHWCRLPGGLAAEELNRRLFKQGAAILKGTDCDMARKGADSSLREFFRFSFGPLKPDSFDSDIEILKGALRG
ncbi:MAG: pyridoxal phosphate-dependent aminotransferase [Vicinamibacteria bacterium]|nr:pyridoxal phosphate-dependent aminotransferase [Vicinamibacteria bacterium]